MQILEHGQAQERTLLFFPCTAEPVWAFADTITLLSQRWHVFQVVYDGHQPEYPGASPAAASTSSCRIPPRPIPPLPTSVFWYPCPLS